MEKKRRIRVGLPSGRVMVVECSDYGHNTQERCLKVYDETNFMFAVFNFEFFEILKEPYDDELDCELEG